ncbi:MAG: CARDB domain-containing protein, partial [Candidatus Bipolaricaulota bacterium]|nr:CARDB domain-containing protein [Candidatus Bipolaricaulota bacterium]
MLKRFMPLVSLLIVLFIMVPALAKPDLVITDIMLAPQDPVAGEHITVTATVENVGASDADGRFSVRFLMDGFPIETPSIPFGLDAETSKMISFDWTAEVGI